MDTGTKVHDDLDLGKVPLVARRGHCQDLVTNSIMYRRAAGDQVKKPNSRFELETFCLQNRRTANCANLAINV